MFMYISIILYPWLYFIEFLGRELRWEIKLYDIFRTKKWWEI